MRTLANAQPGQAVPGIPGGAPDTPGAPLCVPGHTRMLSECVFEAHFGQCATRPDTSTMISMICVVCVVVCLLWLLCPLWCLCFFCVVRWWCVPGHLVASWTHTNVKLVRFRGALWPTRSPARHKHNDFNDLCGLLWVLLVVPDTHEC